MGEHPNTAVARRIVETYNTGRADLVAEMYADDAVLHLAGHNRISGTFRGRAAITAGLTRMFQVLAAGTARADPPESVLAGDEHAMIYFRAQGERNGNTMDQTYVMATTLDPNGKVKELWFLASDQAQYDRFVS